MAAVMWILLRSLWTNLRVCWDVKHTPLYLWLAQIIGWGVPGLFLAISLPITGVSYRLGTTCIPNQQYALVTWFGWLLAFACLAAALQLGTTGFSLWLFMRHFWGHGGSAATASSTSNKSITTSQGGGSTLGMSRRLAWRRVRNVLLLQWRSILLSVLVIIESAYFGVVFVKETQAVRADQDPTRRTQIEEWSICLILNAGDKSKCFGLATVLGIDERTVIASLFMSALIGLFTFALMIRRSMFVGWYEILHNPRKIVRQQSVDDFTLMSPRRWKFGKDASFSPFAVTGPNAAETRAVDDDDDGSLLHLGTLPEPKDSIGGMSTLSRPEAGDVATRHETLGTDMFDEERRGSQGSGMHGGTHV